MIGWEKLLGIMKEIDPEWQKAHDRLKELMQKVKISRKLIQIVIDKIIYLKSKI